MFTPIIGLEIHLQLKTKSKVFCRCSTSEAEPNTNTCPICLGYPGAMPNLNKEAVLQAIRMGIALHCSIAEKTNWDRKSYMYPDLFKGYQISQLDNPVCGEGEIEILVRDRKNYYSKDNYSKSVGIIRAHLEEDTAKSIHGDNETLLDANKAGYPLLEVVSAPEMNTVDEAVSYAKTIRNLARWFSVCDGNLELGQMRFDANISIQVNGSDVKDKKFSDWGEIEYTPIVEIKNLNSFGNLQDALDYEITRQIEAYKETKEVYSRGSKETRGWDDASRKTYIQRKKEEANEYRFLPEPDIPTLIISKNEIQAIKDAMTEDIPHPVTLREELAGLNIPSQAVSSLTEDRKAFEVYKQVTVNLKNQDTIIKVANLLTNELASEITGGEISNKWIQGFKSIIDSLEKKEINSNELKEILKNHHADQDDWKSLLDAAKSVEKVDVREILKQAMTSNPGVVDQIKNGKDSAKMFFVGLVMRETKGKADANEVKNLIDELL